MSGDEALRARIDALEARLTHQDLAIEDLNAALTRQWATIDRLVRQIALLDDRLQEVGGAGAPPNEAPPPHY